MSKTNNDVYDIASMENLRIMKMRVCIRTQKLIKTSLSMTEI